MAVENFAAASVIAVARLFLSREPVAQGLALGERGRFADAQEEARSEEPTESGATAAAKEQRSTEARSDPTRRTPQRRATLRRALH